MTFSLANIDGRAALVAGQHYFDLEEASDGGFTPDCMEAIARFDELAAVKLQDHSPTGCIADARLGPPVPRPRQIFGVGLNYRAHAAEFDLESAGLPLIFAKFPASITGPNSDIILRGDQVDWEVELVAVIGKMAKGITRDTAWNYVAGLTVGQDISDRRAQFMGNMPQFSIAKSFDTYSPIGPVMISCDSVADPNDLELLCLISGSRMQHSRSANLIFNIAFLVEYLSSAVTLLPGDLIFTGTPDGVGMATGRYLRDGDLIESKIEGIGTMHNRCIQTA